MATKSLSKLKTEMIFNQDLARLVDVMKGIAAAQYHMMERKRAVISRYDKALNELFSVYDFRGVSHPFIQSRNPKKLICLVTTDSGFLGGLNMKVVQAGMKHEEKGDYYLVVGERGVNYVREFGKSYSSFPGINLDDSRFVLVEKMVEHIKNALLKNAYGRVILVYPNSISFTMQRLEVLNLIPCPLFFKERAQRIPTDETQAKDVILESPPEHVIEYLTLCWLTKRFVEIFESAKLAEFGARTMHLEESFQTLTKTDKQLKLQFFKARREKIDQSLRETFTAQLICK